MAGQEKRQKEKLTAIILILSVAAIVISVGISISDDSDAVAYPVDIEFELTNMSVIPAGVETINAEIENVFTMVPDPGYYLPALMYMMIDGEYVEGCIYDPSAGTFTIPAGLLKNYPVIGYDVFHICADGIPECYDGYSNCYTVEGDTLYVILEGEKGELGPFTSEYTVKDIGGLDLTNVHKVYFDPMITSIGNYAFKDCTDIQDVTIGKGITTIGEKAFAGCKQLKNVRFYYGINDDRGAFELPFTDTFGMKLHNEELAGRMFAYNSDRFEEIPVRYTASSVSDSEISLSSATDLRTLSYFCDEMILPQYVKSDGSGYYIACCASDPDKHYTVVGICYDDDKDNSFCKVMSIVIAPSVRLIDEYTFSNNDNLRSIDLYNVEKIGYRAFYGCENLRSIYIPVSVNSISNDAFLLSGLSELFVDGENEKYDSCENILFTKDYETLIFCAPYNGMVDYILPDETVTFADYAFGYHATLETINLNNAQTTRYSDHVFEGCKFLRYVDTGALELIHYWEFKDCQCLTEIKMRNVREIDTWNFDGCPSLTITSLTLIPPVLKSTLPTGSVVYVPGCSLDDYKKVWADYENSIFAIPPVLDSNGNEFLIEGDKLIITKGSSGNGVLSTQLTSMTDLDMSAVKKVEIGTGIVRIGNYIFKSQTEITSVTMTDNVENIGMEAFRNCYRLNQVKLSSAVRVLDDYVFSSCGDLHNIDLPDGLTKIGEFAFSFSGLKEITIPASVTKIDTDSPFAGCYSLSKVIMLRPTPIVVDKYTFRYVTEIVVTEGNAKEYRTQWVDYSDIIYEAVSIPSPVSGLIYNGKEQTGVSDERFTYLGNTGVNAGSYTAQASPDRSKKFVWIDGTNTGKDVSWSIGRAEYNMSGITFSDTAVTYNGTIQSIAVQGTLPTGLDGIQLEVEYSAGLKDVGSKSIEAVFKTTSTNYNAPAALNATLTIQGAGLTITAQKQTVIYGSLLTLTSDGGKGWVNNESYSTYSIDPAFINGHLISDYTGISDVGEYLIEWNAQALSDIGSALTNYEVTLVENKVVVDPADIIVDYEAYHGTYDGQYHDIVSNNHCQTVNDMPAVWTFSKDGDAEWFQMISVRDVDEGGTYWYSVTAPNHNTALERFSVTIDPVSISMTSDSDSKVYDGKELVCHSLKMIGGFIGSDGAVYDFTGSQLIVGQSPNTFTYTLNTGVKAVNYSIDTNEGILNVTPAPLVITANGTETDYGTVPQLTADSGSGWINGESAAYYKRNQGYINGFLMTEYEVGLSVGNYAIQWANDAKSKLEGAFFNYEITLVNGNILVNKASYDMSGVEFKDRSVEYDGKTYSIMIEGTLPTGLDDVQVTVSYIGEHKDVGEYVITAAFSTASINYVAPADMKAELTIKKAKLNVTADDCDIRYGSPIPKLHAKSAGWAIGESFDTYGLDDGFIDSFLMTDYIQYDDVGRYPIIWQSDAKTQIEGPVYNYDIVLIQGNVIVDPAEITEVKVIGYSGKYDGSDHYITSSCTAVTVNNMPVTWSFSINGDDWIEMIYVKDALDSSIAYFYKASAPNHNEYKGYISVSIQPRFVTIVSESDEKTYDGTPLTNDSIIIEDDGFVEGEGAVYTVTGSLLAVGEAPNEFTYELNEDVKTTNYNIFTRMGTLSVKKIMDPITLTAASDSKMYDGKELSNDSYEYTGSIMETDLLIVTVSGSITGVGIAENKIASYRVMNGETDVSSCYTFSESVKGELTVSKRSVTITSASDEKEYDRIPLVNDTVEITGDGFVEGEGITIVVTGHIVDVGSTDNSLAFNFNEGTDANNYAVTTILGTLVISKHRVDVPAELYYQQNGSVISFNIPTSEWYSVEDKAKYGVNPGTYTYKLSLEDTCVWKDTGFDGNYNVYITLVEQLHVNSEGKLDVVVSGDCGIRNDIKLTVVEKTDMTSIKSQYEFDGDPKFSYDIKFVKDSSEIQPEGTLTIRMLIPAELRGIPFTISHIHDGEARTIGHTLDGDYALVTVNDLSDFVFVYHEPQESGFNTFFIICLIAAVIIICAVGVALFIRRRERRT